MKKWIIGSTKVDGGRVTGESHEDEIRVESC